MNEIDIKGYRNALKMKAAEFDESLEQYMEDCAINGDEVLLDRGTLPVHWGDSKYNFVVYGEGEADNDVLEGDVIKNMYDWLVENGIYE